MKITPLFLLSAICLSQAHAYNLPQQDTKTYDCDVCSSLSHTKLQASWNITALPLAEAKANKQKSYSYNQIVSAAELRQGVALSTRAPGAIVRISPLDNTSVPVLEITTPQKQTLSLKDASALYAEDEAARESLMGLENQTMLQLKPELGFGNFILQSKNSTKDTNKYLLHVFDKFSLIALQIEPSALHYQYGEQFKAIVSLQDSDAEYSAEDLIVSLIAPDEALYPVKVTKIKRNKFQVSAPLLSELNTHGDNWYVEAELSSGQDQDFVRRIARAAFSYSIPSASLVSIKKVFSKPLTFETTIYAATASRYAIQAVLFHQNKYGQNVPIETAQSAQWLRPGKQTIQFRFDNSNHLAEDKLSVGYLHLTDYGQLKTIYQYDEPIKLSKMD